MKREYPWHLRLPSTEHYQRFKNLVQIHQLTAEWLHEIRSHDDPTPPLSHSLNPVISTNLPENLKENLWMLDSLANSDLESLLDDTSPSETLDRLEQTLWAVQSLTVSTLNESSLEPISWKQGKECGESRWKALAQQGNQDLRDILLALNDSPFSGYPQGNGFLVRRALPIEIQIELMTCPHQNPFLATRLVADRLCRLHAQWIKGFAQALHSQIQIEHFIPAAKNNLRCHQRWFLSGPK